jgi:hypothetical protein
MSRSMRHEQHYRVGIGIAIAVGFDIDPDSDTDSDTDSEPACPLNKDKNLTLYVKHTRDQSL